VLLAVDAGNTETVIGLFEDRELVDHWRVSTNVDRTSDEMALLVQEFLAFHGFRFDTDVAGVVVCSGVPNVTTALREMTDRYFGFPAVVLEAGVRTGMPILYENPREVGPDRIANAVAAFDRYDAPLIVVDFGTATIFDAVSAKGEYLGGVLVPGIDVGLDALVGRAAMLRRVEIVEPRAVIGRSSQESLQSGVVNGQAALVDGLVERISAEIGGEVTTVATGRLAELMKPFCSRIEHVDQWLTLRGLQLIFEKNRPE
jgi:type III pantothenate kinase